MNRSLNASSNLCLSLVGFVIPTARAAVVVVVVRR